MLVYVKDFFQFWIKLERVDLFIKISTCRCPYWEQPLSLFILVTIVSESESNGNENILSNH